MSFLEVEIQMDQLNFSLPDDLSFLCTENYLETVELQHTSKSWMRCVLAGQVSPVVCLG